MLKELYAKVGQYRRAVALAPVLAAGEVVMEVLIPIAMALLIDQGINAGDINKVLAYGAAMIVLALVSLGFGMGAARNSATAAAGLAANLRDAMYEAIQGYSFGNIDKFSTAGLVTRMTTDVTNIQNATMMILVIAVRAPLSIIASFVACVMINARLSLVFVVAILVLGSVLTVMMRTVSPIFMQVFAKYDDLNTSVQENVGAIRVVKAFVREDFEVGKFRSAAQNLYRLFVRAEGLLAFNAPVMVLVIYGCIIALSWFGAQFIVVGDLTTGELTSMFSYIASIMVSLMMLSMVFVMVTMSSASAQRIVDVLDEKVDITTPESAVGQVADGSIEFDHASFSYKHGTGEDVLHDIDLRIASGETIGIVGGTGSGKSSLVSLVSRLYDVTSGAVRVGGVDVRDYDLEVLRNGVAVVLQKNVLFSGTIYDNLRWGNEDATDEECREACRLACADEFIERMPEGYDTKIERGGNNVSGGQKQRLCIARALLKKPSILILDDSTSAVDTATDAKIQAAFASTIPGTTKLIISQRVSSVASADRIIVLDNGRVSGFDTHENLLANNDIYRDIYQMQTAGSGDFDEGGDN